MNKEEIINESFSLAVSGLSGDIVNVGSRWFDYINELPKKQQVAYTIIIFHKEVFNGGLHQFFFNASGQFAYLILENLKLIKAFQTFDILSRALKEVNSKELSEVEFRIKVLNRTLPRVSGFEEQLGDYLDTLDKEYYGTGEDLEQFLADYLTQN